ncbi:MAG: ABC transporter ATP-binding protein [Phycisphaerae bacterium]|nr:ABC transporter ATP-binding protein [Phycisphaerae bacterium]
MAKVIWAADEQNGRLPRRRNSLVSLRILRRCTSSNWAILLIFASKALSPQAATVNSVTAHPAADLRQLRKVYFKPDGSILVEALKSIDLIVPHGQYLAIMGASGSGKSTLMNLLGCLDRPTSGDYFLDGKNVAQMDDNELSRARGERIGFVFQAFNLITELTIVENVEVPLFYQKVHRHERRERAIKQLERVGLGDRLTHRPIELSGGQQQRVAIARALVTRPAILMADEPTGNLDSATGESILQLFEALHAEGLTLIMVTHDDRIAARCERIVRLKDGLVEYDRSGGGRREVAAVVPRP